MKKILIKILAFLAKKIIKKQDPFVVAITGSVGKTSTKEFVSLLLSDKLNLRSSFSNYNNEVGLPLTVIGLKSPGKNVFLWFKVLIVGLYLSFFRSSKYPDTLILEAGIDRLNDMDHFLNMFKSDRVILTNISHSHFKYFPNIDSLRKEKFKLFLGLKKKGLAIINTDNDLISKNVKDIKSSVLSYGLKGEASLLAKDVKLKFNFNENDYGLVFKVDNGDSIVPVKLKNALSVSSVYAALSSLALASSMGYNAVELLGGLENFRPPAGRMSLISGLNNSLILDDTYNSSPESCLNALEFLSSVKKGKDGVSRKVLVLGDMLELGDYSAKGHFLVGERVAEAGIDLLVLIGKESLFIKEGALSLGFSANKVRHFSSLGLEVEDFMLNYLSKGDVVLLKASQGVRLEKLVKALMLNKNEAESLLVRQSSAWS